MPVLRIGKQIGQLPNVPLGVPAGDDRKQQVTKLDPSQRCWPSFNKTQGFRAAYFLVRYSDRSLLGRCAF